jgi:hypothetical protein
MALGYGLLAIAKAPAPAIALFLLAGVFESAFHPTIGALVGDMFGEKQLTHAFAVVRVGANAGRIAGPLIGVAAALVALPLVFAAAGGLLAGALLAGLALIPRDTPSQPDDPEPEIPPGTLRALANDRRLAVLVLAGGLLSVTFAWWEADGLVLLRQQHPLSTTAYAALFTIAAATIVAFQIPVTRRTARIAPGLAMLTGGRAARRRPGRPGIRPPRIPGSRHRGTPDGRRRNDLRPHRLSLRHHPRRPPPPCHLPGRPVHHRRHRHRHRPHQRPRPRRRHPLGRRRHPVRPRRSRNRSRRRDGLA